MLDALSLRGEGINHQPGIINETPKQYGLIEAQTEEYIQQLADFEIRCALPGANPRKLQAEIKLLNECMLDACAEFERNVSDEFAVKNAQVAFRERTHSLLSKGYGINRARTWPEGYQGDYKTIEFIYRNTPMSNKGGLGYYLDRYTLSWELAVGVRERMNKLTELLRNEFLSRTSPNVLDIACGSCRELNEIVPEIEQSCARVTCIDLDSHALDFALSRLSYAGLSPERAQFIQYNALRLFDYETASADFERQDVIYSVGYFDYLPDDFLVKSLRTLYNLLTPGGRLIAAFKDANYYQPQPYHWIVNWDGFLQRTENDFDRLLNHAAIPGTAVEKTRAASGSIIFYSVTRE